MARSTELETQIEAMYDGVPEYIREDVVEAGIWARETLTNKEGSGHAIYIFGTKDGMVECSFAKPSWPGDHCGSPMESGSEAIVMAVCEYLCGG